jgi:thiamine biosynthesis lipoprotein
MIDKYMSESNQKTKPKYVTRREVIKILAISGVGIGLGAKILELIGENQDLRKYNETRLLMGTVINLTVMAPDEDRLPLVIEKTFSEMQRWINILDHRSATSEVGQLNQAGQLAAPSPELLYVIDQALSISAITQGAFDITIKPILDAFRDGLPITDSMKSLVGYQFIHYDNDQLHFNQKGVQVTLDGIAKGAVIDAGVAVLSDQGFENVLVEAGGDLMAAGNRGAVEQWRIGLKNPRASEKEFISVIGLVNQAAATSGDYQYYFSDDYSLNHIIDPFTFKSPTELASVTVLAPTAMEADGFSTAIMVMGSEKGLELAEHLPEIETMMVAKDLHIYKSKGFPEGTL